MPAWRGWMLCAAPAERGVAGSPSLARRRRRRRRRRGSTAAHGWGAAWRGRVAGGIEGADASRAIRVPGWSDDGIRLQPTLLLAH